jgi:hypothetical protein
MNVETGSQQRYGRGKSSDAAPDHGNTYIAIRQDVLRP